MNDENPTYYKKIDSHDIDRGAFCSRVRCEKEDFKLNEVAVLQYGNLFHVGCFRAFDPDLKIHVLRD